MAKATKGLIVSPTTGKSVSTIKEYPFDWKKTSAR